MNYALFGQDGFLGRALKPWCDGDFNAPVWINCRAKVMGIGGNQQFPATLLTKNLKSAMELFEDAVVHQCKRVVNFGSTCVYSPEAEVPFKPCDYLEGVPEPTNSGYAIAKRTIYSMSAAYASQYAMDNLYLVMPNLYGPGFRLGPNNHVIPEMIQKVQNAIDNDLMEVEFKGTGQAEREFLYVKDAALLILRAIKECHTQDPVHLTSGQVITIKDLAESICDKMAFHGNIVWDSSFPDGQIKRKLATGLEQSKPTDFDLGLASTIAYFRSLRLAQEATS